MKYIFLNYLLLLILTLNNKNVYSQIDTNKDSIWINKMAGFVMNNETAYEELRFLCKKIGPRLSGSSNAQKAVEYTASILKKIPDAKVYLQPCYVTHWVRGKEWG